MDKEARKFVLICKCKQFLVDYVKSQDIDDSCTINCIIDDANDSVVFAVKLFFNSTLTFPLSYCEHSSRWNMSELEYTTTDNFRFYNFKEKRLGDVCLEEI